MDRLSYAITSLAPQEVNEQFFDVKAHFDSFYLKNKPSKPDYYILKNLAHLTLKRRFYLREGIRHEEVRSALASVQFEPIPIQAQTLELFQTQKFGNILVVLVDNTPELQKLHDDLSALIATCSEPSTEEAYPFKPHLSVLYEVPEERLEDAKRYIMEHIFPISYTLDSFQFMTDVGVKGERGIIKDYFANK